MNIFVLDNDPAKAAEYIDDIRLPKQCRETAQMLGTAIAFNGAEVSSLPKKPNGSPYSGSHPNHPCSQWVCRNRANFLWLYRHGLALCEEYTRRNVGKVHESHHAIIAMGKRSELIPEGERTPFVQVVPPEFKDDDAVKAYRAYYHSKKNSPAGVRYRLVSWPSWWDDNKETEDVERDDERTAYLKSLGLL